MNKMLIKLYKFYKRVGFIGLAQKFLGRDVIGNYEEFVSTLSRRNASSVFSEIYEKNLWASLESKSGGGSEAAYTANLRKHLPGIFKTYNVKTVVDAPCGDYNWMRLVPLDKDVCYVGIDIVPELISKNANSYSDSQHDFIVMNILEQVPPFSDLFICRDCLFHLSNEDIFLALENFIKSNAKLIFTSTHINQGDLINSDIKTGDFRLLDLFQKPFFFPEDVLCRVDDYIESYPPREMCLWTREDIQLALKKSELYRNGVNDVAK
jgi:hypothetical protein